MEGEHHQQQADDVEAPVPRGEAHGPEVAPAFAAQAPPAVHDPVQPLVQDGGVHVQALDAPLQPAHELMGAPAQRRGVVEQPEAVAGGDEQQHDEDAGDDRRRAATLAAQDEHDEAGGEQGEEHEVRERVLEDHRDEHQGVGHAALLQHAVGDGRAAHAAGGEEVGGGEPGEVDAQGEAERRPGSAGGRAGGGRAASRRVARRTRRRRRRPATPAWRPGGARARAPGRRAAAG